MIRYFCSQAEQNVDSCTSSSKDTELYTSRQEPRRTGVKLVPVTQFFMVNLVLIWAVSGNNLINVTGVPPMVCSGERLFCITITLLF